MGIINWEKAPAWADKVVKLICTFRFTLYNMITIITYNGVL